jgi:hypothetical protein
MAEIIVKSKKTAEVREELKDHRKRHVTLKFDEEIVLDNGAVIQNKSPHNIRLVVYYPRSEPNQ